MRDCWLSSQEAGSREPEFLSSRFTLTCHVGLNSALIFQLSVLLPYKYGADFPHKYGDGNKKS